MTQHAYETTLQLKYKNIASINFRQRRSKARAFALFPLRCDVTVPTKIFVSPASPALGLAINVVKKKCKTFNLQERSLAGYVLVEKWRK